MKYSLKNEVLTVSFILGMIEDVEGGICYPVDGDTLTLEVIADEPKTAQNDVAKHV